jgi:hypothetical protein
LKIGNGNFSPIVYYSNGNTFQTICAKISQIKILMSFNKCSKDLIIQFYYNGILKTGFLTRLGIIRSKSFIENCKMKKEIFISNNKYEISKQGNRVLVKLRDLKGSVNSYEKILSFNVKEKFLLLISFFILILIILFLLFLFKKKCSLLSKSLTMKKNASNTDALKSQDEQNNQTSNNKKPKLIVQSDKAHEITELESSKNICLPKNKEISIKTISFGLNLLADVAEGLMMNEEKKESTNSNE